MSKFKRKPPSEIAEWVEPMLRTTTIDFDSRFLSILFFFYFWALCRDNYFQLKFNRGISFSSEKKINPFFEYSQLASSQRDTISNGAESPAHLLAWWGAWLPVWSRVLIMPNQAEISYAFSIWRKKVFSTRKNRDYKRILRKQESTNCNSQEKPPCSLSSSLFFLAPQFYKCAPHSVVKI